MFPNRGVMAFMTQVHECFFTCDEYPGYVPFLNDHVPTLGMHWLQDVTFGGFFLGLGGLLLLFLGITGIWLWWPTLKRLSHGFRVRWKKGRYARDYDLHQVIGMAAVPFLLMWGLTGASFEFHWVNTAWYAVTGGHNVPDETFTSSPVKDKKTPDISLNAAVASASSLAGPHASLKYISLPAADDPGRHVFVLLRPATSTSTPTAPTRGQYGVDVDRHNTGRTHVNDYGAAPTPVQQAPRRLGRGALPLRPGGQWLVADLLVRLRPDTLVAGGDRAVDVVRQTLGPQAPQAGEGRCGPGTRVVSSSLGLTIILYALALALLCAFAAATGRAAPVGGHRRSGAPGARRRGTSPAERSAVGTRASTVRRSPRMWVTYSRRSSCCP